MTQDDDTNTGNDWLEQAMEGEDAACCISVGGLAVDMGWYRKDRGMTPDEIAAERERFDLWHQSRYGWTWDGDIAPDMGEDERARARWLSWLARAEIARVEQAELRAENERLRERVRFHARSKLKYYLSTEDVLIHLNSEKAWFMAQTSQAAFLLELAEEAGCWFDDDGNEVPLAEWRARMGGAG